MGGIHRARDGNIFTAKNVFREPMNLNKICQSHVASRMWDRNLNEMVIYEFRLIVSIKSSSFRKGALGLTRLSRIYLTRF